MPKFRVGDTLSFEGRRARVVWLSENPNEIEAIDEYILEFEDHERRFLVSSELGAQERPSVHNGKDDSRHCERQTH